MDILWLSIFEEMYIPGEQGIYFNITMGFISACGQLGLSSMKDLPTDIEGYPYQPTPRLVDLLVNIKVT